MVDEVRCNNVDLSLLVMVLPLNIVSETGRLPLRDFDILLSGTALTQKAKADGSNTKHVLEIRELEIRRFGYRCHMLDHVRFQPQDTTE